MIKNKSIVDISHTQKNKGGEELRSSSKNKPLVYLHGRAEIVLGLE